MSSSIENFLKTIYCFCNLEARDTKPGSIASALGISNAAATDMARKLSEKNLVVYQKYRPLNLTPKGERIALQVIRKHRLWETFLYRTFNMSLHEIHVEAEKLEHATSDRMADILWNYLEKPNFDPHGDPIPNVFGFVDSEKDSLVLFKAEESQIYKIVRLVSDDEEFYNFCQDNQLEIGSEVQLVKQYANNKLTEIAIQGRQIIIPKEFSNNIYVKKIKTII
ncbi:metal-dependent transcriptional regulator [Marinifilum caeruleilacunae]|uniref:Transcriptional regulator MntR n=1 Tax=Marinifilum caeruleilacunae TaxID=2499076 RepID=A0ABX1WV01_9BACT|nr:metal-dependent transcriptional regulator [Marinifilum caeruleilacunae]NOU59938.1 metal-dependent transcriptional regulator [Marinifilum caeruleilacunae]